MKERPEQVSGFKLVGGTADSEDCDMVVAGVYEAFRGALQTEKGEWLEQAMDVLRLREEERKGRKEGGGDGVWKGLGVEKAGGGGGFEFAFFEEGMDDLDEGQLEVAT